MKKFIALLKKEIKELLTPQMFLPIIFGAFVFIIVGNLIGSESENNEKTYNIGLVDMDNTETSTLVKDTLSKSNYNIIEFNGDENYEEKSKNDKLPILVIIPENFEKNLKELKPQTIEVYNFIYNISVRGSSNQISSEPILSIVNETISNKLIQSKISDNSSNSNINIQELKHPILKKDYVILNKNKVEVSPEQLVGTVMSQIMFVPIIMFLIIIMASQMIAVAIASEKENKTLETLLSTPIKRTSLVTSKMTAAAIVSLLLSAVYLLGIQYTTNQIKTSFTDEAMANSINKSIEQLGFYLNFQGYILIGISLFLSILIALAISIILGAFAKDVRSAQGFIAPMTFMVMIPYFLSFTIDPSTASIGIKTLLNIIPFSHPMLAAPYIITKNYTPVIYGIIYQLVIFIVFVFIAARIFSTDKILTMKLEFRKKKSNVIE